MAFGASSRLSISLFEDTHSTERVPGYSAEEVDSEEYISNFSYNTVLYQRRRILQGRSQGELPFARMARYGEDYRDKLPLPLTRKQLESFALNTFLRSSDRDVVLWLLASLLGLIVLFTWLTVSGYLPKLGGY